MNKEQRQAYEWAKNQSYQSVAARYAKILAGLVDEIIPPNEPLTCAGCIHEHNEHENCNYCKRASYLGDYYYLRPSEGKENT